MTVIRTLLDRGHAEDVVGRPVHVAAAQYQLPQPTQLLSRVLRIFVHASGRITKAEHESAFAAALAGIARKGLTESQAITRAGLIYEGLTGLRPVIGCLKCRRTSMAVLGLAVNMAGGGVFYSAESVALGLPDPSPERQRERG